MSKPSIFCHSRQNMLEYSFLERTYYGCNKSLLQTNTKRRRRFIMSNSTRNRIEVPEAKEAMDKFKMEVADELGVPLSDGYNGNLTSYQNGSVGGYMVKKMIEAQEKQMSGK